MLNHSGWIKIISQIRLVAEIPELAVIPRTVHCRLVDPKLYSRGSAMKPLVSERNHIVVNII